MDIVLIIGILAWIVLVFFLVYTSYWDYQKKLYIYKDFEDTHYLIVHEKAKSFNGNNDWDYYILECVNDSSLIIVGEDIFKKKFSKLIK